MSTTIKGLHAEMQSTIDRIPLPTFQSVPKAEPDNKPVAGYLCEKPQHAPYFTGWDCTAEHAKLQGWTVTTIHSAL